MRYLRTFGNHNNYEDFIETETFVKPNVSYCIQLNEVHYNPIETRLIVKYNVTDVSEPTKLYEYYMEKESTTIIDGAAMFDKIEIDDVDVPITDVDETQGTYQFTTTGEHIVKYTLKDPTFIGTEHNKQTDTTKIGALFSGCETATVIEIPNSVVVIGDYAFNDCSGLTSITIPNSVTYIGNYAFEYCSGLTSLTIGNSVTSIGDDAFGNCSGLTSLTIPNSVTSIGSEAFLACSGLTSVTIGNSVTSIGYGAFESCYSLTSVTIGNSVTVIGSNAFSDCAGLTSIKVESGNTTYDSRNDCNAIIETASNTLVAGCKNTVIPNSVTSIGTYAFYNCKGLTSVTIPNSVTSIEQAAFEGCSGLTSVTIPNSVTSIGYSAFFGCSGLTSVTISNSMTSIGINVFRNCTGLTSVIIPNSVTSIAGYAFYRCTGLTSVTIGNSVTSISNSAFASCSGLTNIISLATTAPTIQNDTFRDVKTNGTLTVPSGSNGYDAWMVTGNYYLGKYGWTKVEQINKL